MTNRFYRDFDAETFGGPRKTDYRNAFQIDRDRIIHSHALRKLQSKTQVYFSGEHDFYRTRLTHTMEVAQIGRSICHFLLTLGGPLSWDFQIDPDLVEGICLAHDLGHPPFGHAGERVLNGLMRRWDGFEGNAQTLHLLTRSLYAERGGPRGMQPTRALLDGVLKYKTLHRQFRRSPANHFLYDDQAEVIRFVFAGKRIPKDLTPGVRLNAFRSVECQIMDWADDAAYSLNDIVDGVKTGTLTLERLDRWGSRHARGKAEARLLNELVDGIRSDRVERIFSARIGGLITACRLGERDTFMAAKTNRYRFELRVPPEARRVVAFYKGLASDIIFDGPRIRRMGLAARRVLGGLWERCGSDSDGEAVGSARERARRTCNWLAGLTDSGVLQMYRNVLGPDPDLPVGGNEGI
jgi:dGTPase